MPIDIKSQLAKVEAEIEDIEPHANVLWERYSETKTLADEAAKAWLPFHNKLEDLKKHKQVLEQLL